MEKCLAYYSIIAFIDPLNISKIFVIGRCHVFSKFMSKNSIKNLQNFHKFK